MKSPDEPHLQLCALAGNEGRIRCVRPAWLGVHAPTSVAENVYCRRLERQNAKLTAVGFVDVAGRRSALD
jgi:hypothetical protein